MPYKIYNEEEGTCLQCGTTIRGRRDKQFCSLTCKNTTPIKPSSRLLSASAQFAKY